MAAGVRWASHRGAKGAEESLDFSLPRGLIGAGVDEGDAEFRAHERELLGAVVRTVVDDMFPVALCGDRR